MTFAVPAGTEWVAALGSGTMFEVAIVREGDALVVCKRLTSRTRSEPAGRAAIVREAKVLALAQHVALPKLLRVGSDEHGPFLLETRADGVPLTELVEAWRARGEPVPRRLFGHVARLAARAMAEIAELSDDAGPFGIVHGDVAPDHLLFGPAGQIRFVDFGAARWRGMDEPADVDERGTLPFVAPELARGEATPSAATDVYALAATLLYLATGEPPCRERDRAAMLVEIGESGVRLERLDAADLTSVERSALRRALALDAAARATARALAEELGP